ncbi:MAG TPA: hypothetical protein VF234_01765, partial [Limnochordia bacterium]
PAYRSALDPWRQAAALPPEALERLAAWAERAAPRTLDLEIQREANRLLQEVIAPRLPDLWSGRLSPTAFLDEVAPALENTQPLGATMAQAGWSDRLGPE